MIISTIGPHSVGQIHKQFLHGNLFLSPEEYQRENAWNRGQKQLLIDTIFRGMDMPKFYLWKIDSHTLTNGYPEGETRDRYKKLLEHKRSKNDDPDPYVFEVVDGQQRIRTIMEYMGAKPSTTDCYRGSWQEPFGSLADTPMAKGRVYSELNAEQQTKFDETPLTIMVLEKATIAEIRDMFLRLQNGTPLNAQQKRDALGSAIGHAVRQLAEMSLFTTSVAFDNAGAAHRTVASQMLHLQLKDKIVSCTSRQLDRLYEHYKNAPLDASALGYTKNILAALGKVFPEKNPHLNQNYALSIYWLFSRISTTYQITEDQYPRIRDNFTNLDVARLEAMNRDYNHRPQDEVFEDLSTAMSRGNAGVDGISTRHDIVGQFLFEGVVLRSYPTLDPQRVYTHEEKLILYHRANGCCELECGGSVCGRQIDFDDAVVDHIVPHSKQGKTTLENGRIAYKTCNIARGNRDTFDPKRDCHLLDTAIGGGHQS